MKLTKIIVSVLIVFVLLAGGGIFYLTRGLDKGSNVEINDVDLSLLDDGIYNGEYRAGRWTNEVKVTVENHKITDISIVKDALFTNPEVSKELVEKVVSKQSLKVDMVSGATVSSKAYLKSIENALVTFEQ